MGAREEGLRTCGVPVVAPHLAELSDFRQCLRATGHDMNILAQQCCKNNTQQHGTGCAHGRNM